MPRHNNMPKHNIFQLLNHNTQQFQSQHPNSFPKAILQLPMDNHKQLIYHQLQLMVKLQLPMVQLQPNMELQLPQHMEPQLPQHMEPKLPQHMEPQLPQHMDKLPQHMDQPPLLMDKQPQLMEQPKLIKQVDGNKFIQQQLEMFHWHKDKEYHKQDQDRVPQLVSICDETYKIRTNIYIINMPKSFASCKTNSVIVSIIY